MAEVAGQQTSQSPGSGAEFGRDFPVQGLEGLNGMQKVTLVVFVRDQQLISIGVLAIKRIPAELAHPVDSAGSFWLVFLAKRGREPSRRCRTRKLKPETIHRSPPPYQSRFGLKLSSIQP